MGVLVVVLIFGMQCVDVMLIMLFCGWLFLLFLFLCGLKIDGLFVFLGRRDRLYAYGLGRVRV